MDFCRVCLATTPKKDVREIDSKLNKEETHKSYTEVFSFCLDIQVNEESKCRLLCLKCFESILQFYKFKTLALKNDVYFKAVESKLDKLDRTDSEITVKIENETNMEHLSQNSSESYDNQIEIRQENEVKSEDEIPSNVEPVECLLEPDKSVEKDEKTLKQTEIDSSTSDDGWSSNDNEWMEEEVLRSHSQYPKREVKKKQTKQNKDGSCVCLLCNEIFVVRSNLLRHLRSVHGYLCHFCSVRSRSKHAFLIHLRTHTNEKPFVCKECGKGFIEESRLRWHMSVHTGERNYLCKECGKAFKRPNTLYTHALTHSKVKKFQCNYCDASTSKSQKKPRTISKVCENVEPVTPPRSVSEAYSNIRHDHRYENSPRSTRKNMQRIKKSLSMSRARVKVLSQHVKRLKITVSSLKSVITDLKKIRI